MIKSVQRGTASRAVPEGPKSRAERTVHRRPTKLLYVTLAIVKMSTVVFRVVTPCGPVTRINTPLKRRQVHASKHVIPLYTNDSQVPTPPRYGVGTVIMYYQRAARHESPHALKLVTCSTRYLSTET